MGFPPTLYPQSSHLVYPKNFSKVRPKFPLILGLVFTLKFVLIILASNMDILLVGCGFHLSKVPFKPISDLEIDDVIPLDTIKTRQLRAQFHTLTEYHKSQLDDFIRNHTPGEVYKAL